jgi:DNA-binding transcriptional regulator YhcF (GntR family)
MAGSIIHVNPGSPVPKYRQIIESVHQAIKKGFLKRGDKLPSINQVCSEWKLSRDTVLSAYNDLRAHGVASARAGKGYYIESIKISLPHRVFVLFDELNAFKEDLYTSFLTHLSDHASVEIYFHHFNRRLFNSLLTQNNGAYTTYVVMPARFTGTAPILERMSGRVIILDQLPADLGNLFPGVHQNFEKDTYLALMSGRHLLKKYRRLIMVYPGGKEPEGQYKGFLRYCKETSTPHELLSDLRNRDISDGEAYFVIWDRDIVYLVQQARARKYSLGKDIGIISYNDTALKEVVANGITTISTDFKEMGRTLAGLVLEKQTKLIENPSSLIVRGSL